MNKNVTVLKLGPDDKPTEDQLAVNQDHLDGVPLIVTVDDDLGDDNSVTIDVGEPEEPLCPNCGGSHPRISGKDYVFRG